MRRVPHLRQRPTSPITSCWQPRSSPPGTPYFQHFNQYGEDVWSYEELIAARGRLVAAHPRTSSLLATSASRATISPRSRKSSTAISISTSISPPRPRNRLPAPHRREISREVPHPRPARRRHGTRPLHISHLVAPAQKPRRVYPPPASSGVIMVWSCLLACSAASTATMPIGF
jgi:hypothetical protein